MRSTPQDNCTFYDLLSQTRTVALEAYSHQNLPFEKLVEVLHPTRDLSRTPLFQVFFKMMPGGNRPFSLSGLTVERMSHEERASKFDLTMYVHEHSGGIHVNLVYNADLFSPERIQAFLHQFRTVAEQVIQNPHRPLAAYSLLTQEAHAHVPDPSVPLAAPRQPRIPELITRWALDTPDHPAVRQGAQQWSYGELVAQAEKLGHFLAAGGLKAGTVVAISGPPSFGLIVGLLGVLQRGGVLLMVDPALPDVRKSLMLEEANAQVLLLVQANDAAVSWAQLEGIPHVYVSPHTGHMQHGDPPLLSIRKSEPSFPAGDPAYIFFTSSTTGKPQGIVGSHQSLSHFLTWQRDTFAITPADRVAQLTGLSFDVVLRDIFLPLVSGGALCLPEEADRSDEERVLHWLDREHITVLHTVPTVATSWLATGTKDIPLSTLRWVFFAGEPLTEQLVRKWRTAFPGSGELVNLYGPTETTLAKCFYHIPEEPHHGVQPIGRPLPNTQVLIMNERHQLCGIGELGELVIRTPFCSLGPLPSQEPMRSFFHQNPYAPKTQKDLYFTGDLGRYRPDGTVEILGRMDDQVKIRGVRIEPNEVMTALTTHPSVHACFVMAREDHTDSPALVAYVVPEAATTPTTFELRSYVASQLPAAMIPNIYIFLAVLPYAPNGKIDRQALPLPEAARETLDVAFVAPRTPMEAAIAAIWQEVLKLDQLSIHDNFFDLGGHSLLATQVVSRVRASYQVALPLATLFKCPTIEALAEEVENLLIQQLQDMPDDEAEQYLRLNG